MKHLLVAASALACSALLPGCSMLPIPDSTEFTDGGRNYQYQMTTSTMRYANESPLVLAEGNETTRVLALFGMPDFKSVKPGDFSNFKFTTSDPGLTQAYISPAIAKKPQVSGPTNTDLAAVSVNALSTTGLSAGAVGAAGAALMVAGTDTTPDPRTSYGSAICYRPMSEQPDIKRAYVECVGQVVEDVKRALGPDAKVEENKQVFLITGSVDDPATGKQPVTLLVSRVYGHAAQGFAPSDKGGFKANIFGIAMMRFGDLSASKATVEELGQALRSAKRPTIAYRLNASEDFRSRKNAAPVGVY
jgi:hypothetical protein